MQDNLLYKNSELQSVLHADLANNMLNHAYLLYGQNEAVLNEFASSMAKDILLHKNPNQNATNLSDNIDKNIYSDVSVYPKNGKTFKTEDAKQIAEDALVVPFESDYKIYILNGFDRATIPAQNKLLKTLEEPNGYVVFIITTTNLQSVLPTIRSRSKKLFVQTQANNSENSSIQQQCKEFANLLFLNFKASSQVLQFAVQFGDYNFAELLTSIQDLLVQATNARLQGQTTTSPVVQKMIADFNVIGLKKIFAETLLLKQKIESNTNKNMSIEYFLMKILEVRFECQQ